MALNYRSIREFVESKLADEWADASASLVNDYSLSSAPPIAWEGADFDPASHAPDGIHIRPMMSYADASRAELGIGGTTEITGIWAVMVVYKKGFGITIMEDAADAVIGIFNEEQFAVSANNYIYFRSGFISELIEDENKLSVTVVIPFRAFQKGA